MLLLTGIIVYQLRWALSFDYFTKKDAVRFFYPFEREIMAEPKTFDFYCNGVYQEPKQAVNVLVSYKSKAPIIVQLLGQSLQIFCYGFQ